MSPNLQCNLKLVSRFTTDRDCSVIFSKNFCVFQYLSSRKMINNAEMKGGLYETPRHDHSTTSRTQFLYSLALVSDSDTMLWHKRLRHLSFKYLKLLYPSLSSNKIHNYSCEQCILAKQTRIPHPNHVYTSSTPFHLVHSDIWGPSRTST